MDKQPTRDQLEDQIERYVMQGRKRNQMPFPLPYVRRHWPIKFGNGEEALSPQTGASGHR